MPSPSPHPWLIVGSAPGVEDRFDVAMSTMDRPITITCNGGIHLFASSFPAPKWPDYYWLSDHRACELFGRYMRLAQNNGTKIVTLSRNIQSLKERGLGGADIIYGLDERSDNLTYQPGAMTHPYLSGLMCLQIALNAGARHVVMIGMDGYRSSPNDLVADTFDGRHGKGTGFHTSMSRIGPFIQSCADACPGTRFTILGNPVYTLSGANVKTYKRLAGLADVIAEAQTCSS